MVEHKQTRRESSRWKYKVIKIHSYLLLLLENETHVYVCLYDWPPVMLELVHNSHSDF